jgi:hypothetical protein
MNLNYRNIQQGYILLTSSKAAGTQIRVEYTKGYDLLSAADRVNLLYNPETGQYGKDLGQLMDGVDYGGVEVRSFEFGQDLGFDSQPWYTSEWDTYDENFDDETFYTDGSTTKFQLSKPLQDNVKYNIYVNGIRIDDENYDGSSKTYLADDGSTVLALGNPNAIMRSVTTESDEYLVETNNGKQEYFIKIQNIESWEGLYDDTWYNPPSNDVVVVIRKSTSDGSFLPAGSGFDTLIEGGNLQYGTATGLQAEDITIDGDGFVTPTTSKGPEELIPGQLHDTLDLKVFDRAADGGSTISTRNYVATQNQTNFDLDILPHNIYSLIIKINGTIITEDDYTINYDQKTITLDTPSTAGDRVNIISMGGNGERILDIDYFVGDGITKVFVTNIRYFEGIQSYITVNGLNAEVAIFETDSSYDELQGLVGLEFVTPPPENSHIYYALYDTNEENIQRYSEVTVNRFVGDGSTVGFQLDPAPFTTLPLSHNIIVKVDNKVLFPGYTQHWYIVPAREYKLDPSQIAGSTLSPDEVDVYLNGEKLTLLGEYNWDFANSQVILFDNVGNTGDDLEIVIPRDKEYTFSQNTRIGLAQIRGTFEVGETVNIGTNDSTVYSGVVKSYTDGNLTLVGTFDGLVEAVDADDTLPVIGETSGARSTNILGITLVEAGDNLILTDAPAEGAKIDVYKFSRHEIQDIQMETRTNVVRSTLTVGSDEYYDAHRFGKGLVKLRVPALDTSYVWVALNGELLTPNIDYKLVKMDTYIYISRKLVTNDKVQIVHFAATPSNEKFGYRMFKDMLNRTHYKRLNKNNVYTLAEPLSITDKVIVLSDTTNITQPSKELNIPGVIFIEGERIEYFEVNGNELGQLHRGTLGTGPKDIYEIGTECMDQSNKETVPYKDEMVTLIALEDESTQIVLDWLPSKGVDEFEIFVGGRRLRKNAISAYQFQEIDESGNLVKDYLDQDSPGGDVTIEPEFTLSIDNDTAIVNLAEVPPTNSRILVVRRLGKTWQKPGEQLRYADNSIARFIRGATTDLPK